MKKIIIFNLLVIIFLSGISCNNTELKDPERMDWWRDARFGLFIHWGLFSIPAGEWDGKSNHEALIRKSAQIPLEKYNEFVPQFNPVKFDANEWVKMAKDAGMKYIVFVTKHHDGFCLFDSKETDFDIMSTPFKRDVLKELSDACEKQGITLCLYYSIMDWHHPDYLPRRSWEKKSPAKTANFDSYITYMKNQLNELIHNYAKIGVLWFDGEWEKTWTHEQGKDLYKYLKNLQPDLIINNRVDKGRQDNAGMTKDNSFYGDFGTPEQEIPSMGLPGVNWESCMTMNDYWGYNKNDQNWKSSEDLVRKLVDIASKGGNFLLNVGPTSEGLFPDSSIVRLKDIGSWMKENGEAIYGTQASPFKELGWGRCTQKIKDKKTILYLHVFDWPTNGKLIVPGLENKIVKAYALKDNSKKNLLLEKAGAVVSVDVSNITQSNYATVIAIEIEGNLVADSSK